MVGKRSADKPAPDSSGKKQQQNIMNSFKQTTRKPRMAPTEVTAEAAVLPLEYTHELEQAIDAYCLSWAEKCEQESNMNTSTTRDEVDLDGRGMHVIRAFTAAAELAAARHQMVTDGRFLDQIILVLRNDIVHQHSHVSRTAHAALMGYLAAHPYAKAMRYPTEGSAGREVGQPYIQLNPRSVWLPLEEDLQSFSSKYLLGPDMAIAGRNWRRDRETSLTSRRIKDNKWGSPLELILHCVERGVESAELDFNGDLMMLEYLLVVIEQDLQARLTVHCQLAEEGGGDMDDATAGKRKALLENSLAWRIFACSYASADVQKRLVLALVRLIVGTQISDDGSDSEDAAMLNQAAEEPDDDAPAGASVFTRRELAALASRVLNIMTQLHGTAEAAGGFHCRGNHRSAGQNYRMAMDVQLLGLLWTSDGVGKKPEYLRALLHAMAPRDALRFLGLFIASKFTKTYIDQATMKRFNIPEELDVLHAAHDMLGVHRAADIQTFFEVDVVPALASLHCDPNRAVKSYFSVNHLAVVIGGVAAAVAALVAAGEEVPTGPGGMAAVKKELGSAIKAVMGLANENKDASCRLNKRGVCELAVAQMTIL